MISCNYLNKTAIDEAGLQNLSSVVNRRLIRSRSDNALSNLNEYYAISRKGTGTHAKGLPDKYKGKIHIGKGATLSGLLSKDIRESPYRYKLSTMDRIKNVFLKNKIPTPSEQLEKIKSLSYRDTKILNQMGRAHELQETLVKKKHYAPIQQHISPKVLFDEHNMVVSMGNKSKATEVFRNMRKTTGDTRVISDLTRGNIQLNQGQKIPKAMKKHYIRKYQEIGNQYNIKSYNRFFGGIGRFGSKYLNKVKSQSGFRSKYLDKLFLKMFPKF